MVRTVGTTDEIFLGQVDLRSLRSENRSATGRDALQECVSEILFLVSFVSIVAPRRTSSLLLDPRTTDSTSETFRLEEHEVRHRSFFSLLLINLSSSGTNWKINWMHWSATERKKRTFSSRNNCTFAMFWPVIPLLLLVSIFFLLSNRVDRTGWALDGEQLRMVSPDQIRSGSNGVHGEKDSPSAVLQSNLLSIRIHR